MSARRERRSLEAAAQRLHEGNGCRIPAATQIDRIALRRERLRLDDDDVQVDGPRIRQVLRTTTGDILRSNTFTLSVSRSGRRLTRLVADGGGNGHGVGLCQWGAVGRARMGQDYRRILAAYYPGTELERLY